MAPPGGGVNQPPKKVSTHPGLGPSNEKRNSRYDFDDEPTNPGSQAVVLYQHLLIVFDAMTPCEQTQLLSLANAFLSISKEEKTLLVAAAERLARI